MEKGEILIVKLSSIGDVVHTLPSLEALCRLYPHARITWLVEEESSGILRDHPRLSRILVSKRKQWVERLRRPSRWLSTLKEIGRFTRELRSVEYDLVIDFQGLLRSGLLVFLCHGKRKAGFDRSRELSYLFLTERYPTGSAEQHAVERNLNLVKALSSSCDDPEFWDNAACVTGLSVSDQERRTVDGFLGKHGIDGGNPLIVVHAMPRWETKKWDVRRFARLSDRLIDDYGAHIVFTGQKNDAPFIERIISFMNKPAVNGAGETTLKGLACLFQRAQLVITTDSGPMHIAAAMGASVVALFGPTAPWRSGPYSKCARIVRSDLFCSPCFKKKCNHTSCMKGISVEAVRVEADNLLRRPVPTGESPHCDRL